MVGLPSSAIALVGRKLKDIASDIVTVRTGTVVSNYAAMSSTIVTLDNDPDQISVQAQSLWQALPSGARVTMIAFPPRGLVIVGVMNLDPVNPHVQQFTSGTTAVPYPGNQYRYVEIQGCGGGGAGGGASTSTAGNSSFGSGGGAGMWGWSVFRLDEISWPLSVVPGAGGVAVSAAAGGNGGRSQVNHNPLVAGVPTLTKLWAEEGGTGGGTLANSNVLGASIAGGAGPAEGGVQFLAQSSVFGGAGERVIRTVSTLISATANAAVVGGHGGASFYGGGSQGGANAAGAQSTVPGAGGGGASSFNAGSGNLAGGNGQVGFIQIRFT